MRRKHQPVGTPRPRLPISWRSRAVVVLVLVIGYTALFYEMARLRASRSSTDGPPMLTPVISKVGVRRGDALRARPSAPPAEDQSTPPPRHWIFPAIDICPSSPEWSASLSQFTPVTDARPDPRDTQTPAPAPPGVNKPAARRSTLRMVVWLRPKYSIDWALAGMEGPVLLDLLIDPHGEPIKVAVARGSGSPELDEAALRAAGSWRFAPPRWNSQPVEVWARVELRYDGYCR